MNEILQKAINTSRSCMRSDDFGRSKAITTKVDTANGVINGQSLRHMLTLAMLLVLLGGLLWPA